MSIYINFTLSSFGKIEMTKLSTLTGSSYDVFTKHLLLNNKLNDDRKLWQSIKPFLRDYENQIKYKYILFDKWFASISNLVFIEEELKKN